jgi:hypothetical protein
MISEKDYVEVRMLSSGTIYKTIEGLLIFRQISGKDHVTLDELNEQLVAFQEIQKGTFSPLMVVAEKLKKLDNEEKMFLVSTVSSFANKVAVVAPTPIPKFVFNILFFLSRPSIPCKVFDTETAAINWLNK